MPRSRTVVLGGCIAVLWTVYLVNLLLAGSLLRYGVIPRSEIGLRGVIFAPFLHVNLAHIVANTVPFLILGWLVTLRDPRHFLTVTAMAMLGSGIMAWLFGAPGTVHVGASGVVFGYLGFLMLSGWFDRSIGAIVMSVVVTVLWGGLVFGVMPGLPGVSWQGHLGGFIGGILAARHYRKP